jgi:DNA-binding transcriptional ArsR family regulator
MQCTVGRRLASTTNARDYVTSFERGPTTSSITDQLSRTTRSTVSSYGLPQGMSYPGGASTSSAYLGTTRLDDAHRGWCCIGEIGMYPGDIASTLCLSTATVTHHLRVLCDVGLVQYEQQGRHRLYRVTGERWGVVSAAELEAMERP